MMQKNDDPDVYPLPPPFCRKLTGLKLPDAENSPLGTLLYPCPHHPAHNQDHEKSAVLHSWNVFF